MLGVVLGARNGNNNHQRISPGHKPGQKLGAVQEFPCCLASPPANIIKQIYEHLS